MRVTSISSGGLTVELKITKLFKAICPSDYSASRAEIGNEAGADTWRAACEDSEDYSDLLEPEGAKQALIDHLTDMGYSESGELSIDDTETLTALLLQLVSGDMRNFIGFGETAESWGWDEYEYECAAGTCSCRLFKGVDDEIYYYLGS